MKTDFDYLDLFLKYIYIHTEVHWKNRRRRPNMERLSETKMNGMHAPMHDLSLVFNAYTKLQVEQVVTGTAVASCVHTLQLLAWHAENTCTYVCEHI